jgi:DNA repair ATPase RecN
VSKAVEDGRTVTAVERLTGRSRQQELARMMAGGAVSATVLASASELLAGRKQSGESEAQAKGESETPRAKGRK